MTSKKDKLEKQVDPELLKELQEMQNEMKKKLIILDDNKYDDSKLKYIGALDISFSMKTENLAYAVLAIYEYSKFDKIDMANIDLKKKPKKIVPVYTDCIQVMMTFPYIAGYLYIRELPHYTTLLERLKQTSPNYYPDLLLIDANGILHKNEGVEGVGCACSFGVTFDIATIGVSKTFFNVGGLTETVIKDKFLKECKTKYDSTDIIDNNGKNWGCCLKTTNEPNSKTVMYVSVGYKIDIKSALTIVRNTCLFATPEPIRTADLMGREAVRKYEKGLGKEKIVSDA